jgi:hypothetical protein
MSVTILRATTSDLPSPSKWNLTSLSCGMVQLKAGPDFGARRGVRPRAV